MRRYKGPKLETLRGLQGMKQIVLGVDGMRLEDLAAIAAQGARVRLAKESEERIIKCRGLVDKWLREGRVIYGVTTGFGALSDVAIAPHDVEVFAAKYPA